MSTIDVPLAGLKEGYWSPEGIFVSGNRLYILNGLSIVILDLAGGSIKEITANDVVGDAFYVHNGGIVIIGTKEGSIDTFRVLDENGKEIRFLRRPFRYSIQDPDKDRQRQSSQRNAEGDQDSTIRLPMMKCTSLIRTKYCRIQVFRGEELFTTLSHDVTDGPVSDFVPGILSVRDQEGRYHPRLSSENERVAHELLRGYLQGLYISIDTGLGYQRARPLPPIRRATFM